MNDNISKFVTFKVWSQAKVYPATELATAYIFNIQSDI